ncbi:MAG: hypothetical protein KDK48_05585 [Chlamydiia bacterium]|nr:hypothetical protein [Chlamydiia bacterium]
MNPISQTVKEAYTPQGRIPNARAVENALLTKLPEVILQQGESLEAALQRVQEEVAACNTSERMRVTIDQTSLIRNLVENALQTGNIQGFERIQSSSAGREVALQKLEELKGLAAGGDLGALETLIRLAPDAAAPILDRLFLATVNNQLQGRTAAFELGRTLTEISKTLPGYSPQIFENLENIAITGVQAQEEPYRSVFHVISTLDAELQAEPTIERFKEKVNEISTGLAMHEAQLKNAGERDLPLQVYRRIAAGMLERYVLSVEPLFAAEHINAHDDAQLMEYLSFKETVGKAAALLGTEISVERQMEVSNDAFITNCLRLQIPDDQVWSWLGNPPEDQELFSLWIEEGNANRFAGESLQSLYTFFNQGNPEQVQLLETLAESFSPQPTFDELREFALGKSDLQEFAGWLLESYTSGLVTPGLMSLQDLYGFYQAVKE